MLKALKSKKFFKVNNARSFLRKNLRIVALIAIVFIGAAFLVIKPYNNDTYAGWGTCDASKPNQYCLYISIPGGTYNGGNVVPCPSWIEDTANPAYSSTSCWNVTAGANTGGLSCEVYLHCHEAGGVYPGSVGNAGFTFGTYSWGPGAVLTSLDTVVMPGSVQDLGAHARCTVPPPSFQPAANSQMQDGIGRDLIAGTTVSFRDSITAYSLDNPWQAGTSVPVNVTLHGPYPTRMTAGLNNATQVGNQTVTFTAPGTQDVTFPGISLGGYYYAKMSISKAASNPSANVTADWSSAEFIVAEMNYVKVQPYVISDSSQYFYQTPGSNIQDVIILKAARQIQNIGQPTMNIIGPNDNLWPTGAPVKVCVDLYRASGHKPIGTNQTVTNGALLSDGGTYVKTVCTGDAGQPAHFTTGGQSQTLNFGADSATLEPSYYYFVARINMADQTTDTRDLMLASYVALFNPSVENEWAVRQFSVKSTSNATTLIQTLPGAGTDMPDNPPETKGGVSNVAGDTIRVYATAPDGSDPGIGHEADHWLIDSNGKYMPVKFCVDIYGPFQQRQAATWTPSAGQLSVRPDSSELGGGDVTGGNTFVSNNGATICKITQGETEFQAFYSFNFGELRTPGYYHYVVSMTRADQTTSHEFPLPAVFTGNPNASEHTRDYLAGPGHSNLGNGYANGNWTAQFAETPESSVTQFLIKATSQAMPLAVANSTDYTVGDGMQVKIVRPDQTTVTDRVTLKSYRLEGLEETDNESRFWLKDTDGKYYTFQVCVDLYGPYQSPIITRNPLTGLGSSTDTVPAGQPRPNLIAGTPRPDNQQCFWTNPNNTNNANVTYVTGTGPADAVANNGGSGVAFDVKWQNQGNTYFIPGYYYFVVSVKKENNDAHNVNYFNDRGGLYVNGDLLIEDWYSPWVEQSEAFVAQFQPVSESVMNGNRYEEDIAENDRGDYKGVVFDCDENKDIWTYSAGSTFLNTLPPAKLTCRNVIDKIYIGATDNRDINVPGANDISDGYVAEPNWLKDAAGNYELIRFQVKLYGPFATPEGRIPGSPAVGKSIQVVPYQPIGSSLPEFVNYAQPVAVSDIITANNGPRYEHNTDSYYEATFKQSGSTTLKLAPGFYVSVVEILKPVGSLQIAGTDNVPLRNTNTPVGDLFIRDFYSAWGDPYESTSIPIPVYVWSQRGGSDTIEYQVGEEITDHIWIKGFTPQKLTEPYPGAQPQWSRTQDALGRDMYIHTALNYDGQGTKWSGFPGKPGYFRADPEIDIKVTLYGPYDDRPDNNTRQEYCKVYDKNSETSMSNANVAGFWEISSRDFNFQTPMWPTMELPSFTIPEKGWYTYFIEFAGGERVFPFTSKCNDPNEQFVADGEQKPKVKTQISPTDDDNPVAPTVITDKVIVTGGGIEPNSVIRLSLFKRVGASIDINADTKLCTVQFKISATGQFDTKNYINETDGTVNTGSGSGRCFASSGGFYYWYEEFEKPGGEPYHPGKPGGPGEEVTINPGEPSITTKAQPDAVVGEQFGDTAIVSGIDDSDTRQYLVVVEAFGPQPAGSTPVCDEPFFTSDVIVVDGNDEYPTNKTSVSEPGNVYWIEYLYEDENGNGVIDEDERLVDKGSCGQPHETTRINEPKPNVKTEPQATAKPGEKINDKAIITGTRSDRKYILVVNTYFSKSNDKTCSTSNLIHRFVKPGVGNGTFMTDEEGAYYAPNEAGMVYNVEQLWEDTNEDGKVDGDIDGNNGSGKEQENGDRLAAAGFCGQENETTTIIPDTPESGAFIRNIFITLALGALVAVLTWQLTSKNVLLIRKR